MASPYNCRGLFCRDLLNSQPFCLLSWSWQIHTEKNSKFNHSHSVGSASKVKTVLKTAKPCRESIPRHAAEWARCGLVGRESSTRVSRSDWLFSPIASGMWMLLLWLNMCCKDDGAFRTVVPQVLELFKICLRMADRKREEYHPFCWINGVHLTVIGTKDSPQMNADIKGSCCMTAMCGNKGIWTRRRNLHRFVKFIESVENKSSRGEKPAKMTWHSTKTNCLDCRLPLTDKNCINLYLLCWLIQVGWQASLHNLEMW